MPAANTAINVLDWASRIGIPDTQQIGWQKSVVLGQRARSNPFSGLIGGLNGMKPITEIMDFTKIQGQQIVITLDRPLGGPGTQGPASLRRVVGRGENPVHATFRCTVGLFAHMVDGEQIVETETIIGGDWDNRQRKKLTEYFAWKQGDDIQFEMFAKSHPRNTIYPNNKASLDDLGTNDFLNLSLMERNKLLMNANQAGPFDIRRSEAGAEILEYLVMGSSKAFNGLSNSNAYQNLMANADMRGDNNKLFKGGLPKWSGTRMFDWAVEDGTQAGPLGAPCAPIAYLGADIQANGTNDAGPAPFITGGYGLPAAAVNVEPKPLFMQYYKGSEYMAHEGVKIKATNNVTYYAGMPILTGADVGKIAIVSYQINDGNKITILNRMGVANSGYVQTVIGSMTIDGAGSPWTSIAGPNGFKGVSVGVIPAGTPIYQINAKGTSYVYSFGLGRNAIIAGYGNIAPNKAYGSGGGSPGQRLFEAQDAGRLYSVGWQQVWGATASQNANNMVNGYTLIVSAYQPPGWPDIV